MPELKKPSLVPIFDERSLAPILCSIPQAAAAISRPPQAVYDLIGAGKIEAVKSDGRTLVKVKSLQKYCDELPEAKIAPPRRRKPQRMRAESNA